MLSRLREDLASLTERIDSSVEASDASLKQRLATMEVRQG